MKLRFLPVLCLLLVTCPFSALAQGGFQGWKFGMTPEEVKAVKDCTPYLPVQSTGGLECPNFSFLQEKIPISFIFNPNLVKIQVWVYEGKDKKEAGRRLSELITFLKTQYGSIESPQIEAPEIMKPSDWEAPIEELMGLPPENSKWQFKPSKNQKDFFVFASFISHPQYGFYLFLYFQPPKP
jgi:hypothetical protein